MRKLKFHERKLLKKVDFLHYADEHEVFEKEVRVWVDIVVIVSAMALCLLSIRISLLLQMMRQFHLQKRDDYRKYLKICQKIRALVDVLRRLDATDATRIDLTEQILNKSTSSLTSGRHLSLDLLNRLYNAGVIRRKSGLEEIEKLSVAAFARRRLAVVMLQTKMMSNVKEAATFIEQGHVRVGPEIVTNPAFHVTRHQEDYIAWVDTSKIKHKVMKYNDTLDDYDVLN